jgi:hypothetical protein
VRTDPFFILANPRSGSSLLRIILDCNSQITVPPECGFLLWWYEKYKTWNISNSLSDDQISAFVLDIQNSKKFSTWECSNNLLISVIKSRKPVNVQELFVAVYKSYELKRGKTNTVIGDKNNYYINNLNQLDEIYKNSKYIHLVRDGRDVAASYLELKKLDSKSGFQPNLSSNINEIAQEWSHNNSNIHDFLKTKKDNSMTIRFEDLILDIEKTCLQLTSFLGVDFDLNMLNFFNINAELGLEPKQTLDWKKKTLQPLDESVIGRYKNVFSDYGEEDFFINGIKNLKKYGYVNN